MQQPEREASTRRIAVILGTGESGRLLLENIRPLLVTKAAIEVSGVFVEDSELQHAANLPFVKELCRLTYSLREFHSHEFERAVAMRMQAARKALDELARHAGIAHTFRNVRGSALTTLLETALESDITIFQPLNLFATAPLQSGSRALPSARHLLVGINDPACAAGALIAAGVLARGHACRVTVLMAGIDADDREILTRLARRSIPARSFAIKSIGAVDEPALLQAIRLAGADMVVLGATRSLLTPDLLRQLRVQLRCPVFLVRQWPENHDDEKATNHIIT